MSRFTDLMAQSGQYQLIKNKSKDKTLWHVTEEKETIVNHTEENQVNEEENQFVKYS